MSDITINKNTATTPGAPRLVLKANDKIYLATAVKSGWHVCVVAHSMK